jgi:SSS family solute:Na+ symporter
MLLPIYQALISLMLLAGFCSVLIVPGLKGTDVDQSFLLVVQHYYPPWVLGLVAAAGALAALVPASALLLAAASVAMKNIAGDVFGLGNTPASQTRLTRILVLVVALLALVVWLLAQRTVVELLLLYYNGVTQCAPGVFAAFLWRRATALGVGAGIATGLLVAIPLAAMSLNPWGVNAGLIGLGANVVVLVLVSLLKRPDSTDQGLAKSAAKR